MLQLNRINGLYAIRNMFFSPLFCIIRQTEKDPYKINSGAKSEAKLPAVYRAHHNARILCVMEHPTLKTRLNSSILLDVQCKAYIFNGAYIQLISCITYTA